MSFTKRVQSLAVFEEKSDSVTTSKHCGCVLQSTPRDRSLITGKGGGGAQNCRGRDKSSLPYKGGTEKVLAILERGTQNVLKQF